MHKYILMMGLLLLGGGHAMAEPPLDKALNAYQSGDFKTANRYFRIASANGSKDAQYNLAVMLYQGKGVPQDKSEAVYWFLQAARQGDVSAQYNLGVLYATDPELPDEYPKMDRGQIYFEVSRKPPPSNMQKAVDWYEKAAAQGHESAQLNLGVLYNQGKGVEQDYAKAANWYEKAAEKGNAMAQLNLGILYDLGQGVERNVDKAKEWYEKAAMQGIRDAQYNLGIVYFNGEGENIRRDLIKSYAWLSLAADQGSELAILYRQKVESKLKVDGRRRAKTLAMQYYKDYVKPFNN